MSGTPLWREEREATKAFWDLQDQAERCRDLYVRAHMQLPEPLRRFLGLGALDAATTNRSVMSPPPFPRPSIASDEWVWVDIAKALPITAIAAVLRDEQQVLRAKDVVAKVTQLLPKVSSGSVANLFTKLDGRILQREEGGWRLLHRDKAPIIYEGRLWGHAEAFQKSEIAAYRRDVIVHLLKQFASGFQIVQIVEQLANLPWLRAPHNKDLVKEDMQALQAEGRVRHRGNSRKWEVTPERED